MAAFLSGIVLFSVYISTCSAEAEAAIAEAAEAEVNGEIIDFFYDEADAKNWIILSQINADYFVDEWNDKEAWDSVTDNLETMKGHKVTRKCNNVFEYRFCLCQFQRLLAPHYCHRNSDQNEVRRQRLIKKEENDDQSEDQEVDSPKSASENMQNWFERREAIHSAIDDAESRLDADSELEDDELNDIARDIYDMIGEVEERILDIQYRRHDLKKQFDDMDFADMQFDDMYDDEVNDDIYMDELVEEQIDEVDEENVDDLREEMGEKANDAPLMDAFVDIKDAFIHEKPEFGVVKVIKNVVLDGVNDVKDEEISDAVLVDVDDVKDDDYEVAVEDDVKEVQEAVVAQAKEALNDP